MEKGGVLMEKSNDAEVYTFTSNVDVRGTYGSHEFFAKVAMPGTKENTYSDEPYVRFYNAGNKKEVGAAALSRLRENGTRSGQGVLAYGDYKEETGEYGLLLKNSDSADIAKWADGVVQSKDFSVLSLNMDNEDNPIFPSLVAGVRDGAGQWYNLNAIADAKDAGHLIGVLKLSDQKSGVSIKEPLDFQLSEDGKSLEAPFNVHGKEHIVSLSKSNGNGAVDYNILRKDVDKFIPVNNRPGNIRPNPQLACMWNPKTYDILHKSLDVDPKDIGMRGTVVTLKSDTVERKPGLSR